MIRERDIESGVCRWAEAHGWRHRKWKSPNNRGVPDRLFFRDGRVIAIEFKAPGREPRKLQRWQIRDLVAAGLECHVVDSVEAGRRALA
jgi:hypothetical protein